MLTPRSILVLCDGNYCRSPIAQALLQRALGPGWRVESAGLTALEDLPAHPEAQRLAALTGLDLSRHRGRQLTPAMALAADLILVMDQRQLEDCQRMVPSVRGRAFLLGAWRPEGALDIADPFQQDSDFFQQIFEQIVQSVEDWLPHLVNEKGQHEHAPRLRSQKAPFQSGRTLLATRQRP